MERTAAVISLATMLCFSTSVQALADYATARDDFNRLPEKDRDAVVLGLVLTGDFDGLVNFGFTRRLYEATRRFEKREHLAVDGSLQPRELALLKRKTHADIATLGVEVFQHPASDAKLLVPKGLFDEQQRQGNAVNFSRRDQNLSLNYTVFPHSEVLFDDLYGTMTQSSRDRIITYSRRFQDHFVITGLFKGHRYYTWIERLPSRSIGFTISWSTEWDELGRKLSALLANNFDPGSN